MTAAPDGSGEALSGALEYAAAGYVVGPVTIRWVADERGGHKVAEFHTRWQYPAEGEVSLSADPEQIAAWARAHPGCGFHAPCGPNGFVVPEGDVKRAQSGGVTPIKDGITAWRDAGGPRPVMTVRTPSGGQHWYFAAPAEPIHNSQGAVLPGVDVRGEGGTVFIAGTRVQGHPNGAEAFYSTDRVVPVSELSALPPTWEQRLRAASKGSGRSTGPAAAPAPSFATPDQFHERTWIEDQVRDACARADRLSATSEFRWEFYGVAVTLYTAANAGVITVDEAEEVLVDAVHRTWDAPPDHRDRNHMANARMKARANPWRVRPDLVRDEVGRGQDEVPPWATDSTSSSATTSTNTLADLVRDEVGRGRDEDERPSWAPVDLGPYLDGSYVPPVPEFCERTDGHALFYAGRVHWLFGENESGKSWIALVTVARVLLEGRPCLFVDYESDPGEVTGRLTALGVPAAVMLELLSYVAPETSTLREASTYGALLEREYAVAVVDGVTAAMGTEGKSIVDNDEITDWVRIIPKRIARATGAAVLVIDHVVKDREGRGRFPVGGQQKLNEVTGSAYMVEPGEFPIMKGHVGQLVLWVAKDRPSGVRPHCGEWQQATRMQEAARVEFDARDPEALSITIGVPDGMGALQGGPGAPEAKRKGPDEQLMARISEFVHETQGDVSKNAIEKNVTGNAAAKRYAIHELVRLGYLTQTEGKRGALMFGFARRYTPLLDLERAAQTGQDDQEEGDDD